MTTEQDKSDKALAQLQSLMSILQPQKDVTRGQRFVTNVLGPGVAVVVFGSLSAIVLAIAVRLVSFILP